MLKALDEVIQCVADDTNACGFYLWNFFYWKSYTYKYFIEVIQIYIPEQIPGGFKYNSVMLDDSKCYYLGEWPSYWNNDNRCQVSPAGIMTENISPIGSHLSIPGEYLADQEIQTIGDVYEKYGGEAIAKWANKDRLTPKEKLYYMEKIENPDGTWQDSIFEQIDEDLADLTIFYKIRDLEDMYSREHWFRKIDEMNKACRKKYYPEEKTYKYTPPKAKDLDKPLTELTLPEPTRNPAPPAIKGSITYVLNLVMELIPEKALIVSTTMSAK